MVTQNRYKCSKRLPCHADINFNLSTREDRSTGILPTVPNDDDDDDDIPHGNSCLHCTKPRFHATQRTQYKNIEQKPLLLLRFDRCFACVSCVHCVHCVSCVLSCVYFVRCRRQLRQKVRIALRALLWMETILNM